MTKNESKTVSKCLEVTQLIAGVFGHAIGGPGGSVRDFDFDAASTFQGFERLAALGDELRAGWAHGAGQRHVDLNVGLGFVGCVGGQVDVVDQTQIDDVDEQFGVDNLLELLADFIFANDCGHICCSTYGG